MKVTYVGYAPVEMKLTIPAGKTLEKDFVLSDALKRILGINVQYDQGKARFGQARGTSADLSSTICKAIHNCG